MSNAVWVDDTPFCAGCGEILSQEDQDFDTCACCGGDGFSEYEDDHEDDYAEQDGSATESAARNTDTGDK